MARRQIQKTDAALANDLAVIPLRRNPNRFRYAVALTGISQQQVSVATGISTSRLSQISRGYGGKVTPTEADAIARFFGASVQILFPSLSLSQEVA